jgi:hypothetical protein
MRAWREFELLVLSFLLFLSEFGVNFLLVGGGLQKLDKSEGRFFVSEVGGRPG